MFEPLGLYFSFPFCRAKCSYCNFASDVFPRRLLARYLNCLRREMAMIAAAEPFTGSQADTLYWGGGTPSLLEAEHVRKLAPAPREHWIVAPDAEFTLEAAPGTLDAGRIEAWRDAGVNRISLGVQSWQPEEIRSVGRLHSPEDIRRDLELLRRSGIENINLDLIAGLPHQTEASWRASLAQTLDAAPPHISIYMLEVDEDSRLGRELLAGGARYHAPAVPGDEQTASFYEWAIETLAAAGWRQYEISNFARPGAESRHNLRYWTRRPYLGFGLEAHSMLRQQGRERRWGNPAELHAYLDALEAGRLPRNSVEDISSSRQLEEAFFLGLRRNAGIAWNELETEFGAAPLAAKRPAIAQAVAQGMLEEVAGRLRLTPRGRMLSNSVFAELLD